MTFVEMNCFNPSLHLIFSLSCPCVQKTALPVGLGEKTATRTEQVLSPRATSISSYVLRQMPSLSFHPYPLPPRSSLLPRRQSSLQSRSLSPSAASSSSPPPPDNAMASRFKSLFPWSSTIPDNLPRGRSYEPPISSADYLPRPKPPPLQQPSRDAPVERPKTAPQKAATWDASDDPGRTRSGFSMKSPPALQHTSRKNSVSSTRSRRSSIWTLRTHSEAPPPVPDLPHAADLPPLPLSPAVRSFTTSGLSSPSAVSSPTSPTSLQSPKDTPRPSPKPYIDVMAAHTAIMTAKRSRPLIVRDYGEAVADRNIATFGDMASDKPYTTRARPKHIEILVKGDDGMNMGRDTPQNNDAPPPSPGITSIRSFTGPRPGIAYPPRSDSLRSDHTASSDERAIPSIVVQDRRGRTMSPLASPVTSVFEDPQVKALPPRPATTSPSPSRQAPPPPPSERAPEGERRRSPSVATVRSTSHSKAVPPLPPSRSPSRQASMSSSPPEMASLSDSPRRRARVRPEAGMSRTRTSIASRDDALPTRNASSATQGTTYSSSNISLSTANGTATPRTTSPHSVSTRISTHTPSPSTASITTAASRKRASSRNGSVSYSAFPSYASRENRLSDASAPARRRSGSRSVSRRRDYTGSKGTADLAPMVGRENSVETTVTTKLAPGKFHSSPCNNRSPTVSILHKTPGESI